MHIVVLAYGPSQVTKRAVNRARKLAGGGKKVTTVAASAVGKATAGVGMVDSIGRVGLETALALLPNEPTLIIHDDVVITTKGLMALQKGLAQGNRFVVPYTNDPNTDHFVGPLPIAKAAERELDRADIPTTARSATTIRPACVAAARDDLRQLLVEPLADPHATTRSTDYGFVVAAGAAASHSSQCLQRTVVEDQDERPLLVAALIVRDEEKMLPDCLDSLQSICDRIEVCDTGSTDNTIAIAEAAGANVVEREWPNDFGAARNYVLEQCRDARYVLVIDADERVRCPDPNATRRYLATYCAEHPALSVDVTNLSSDDSELYTVSSVRLFHGTGTEYRGALHETVYRIGDSAPIAGSHLGHLAVDHYGYTEEVVAARSKSTRNLKLAEAQYEAAGDARAAVHLARSLSYAGESPERALHLLEQSLREVDSEKPTTRAQILALMADRCLELDRNQRAFELAHQALQLMPVDDTAAGLLAAASERLHNHEEFIAVAEEIRNADSPREAVRVDHNRAVYRNRLAVAYAATDRPEEAVAEAIGILTEHPDEFYAWPPLIERLHANYGPTAIEVLAPLTVMDQTGRFLEPMITTYPTATIAQFCALYVSQGGVIPEAIRVGVLAAAMAGDEQSFRTVAGAAVDLDPAVRGELADRIAASGHTAWAARLRPQPVLTTR